MSALTITILEEATVFEGAETVYRYDLVPPVLAEPWALTAVVEQAQAVLMAGEQPAQTRVVTGVMEGAPGYEEAANAAEAVRGAVQEMEWGVGVSPEGGRQEPREEVTPVPTVEPTAPTIGAVRRHGSSGHRPTLGRSAQRAPGWRRFTWLHAAMVGVIIAVMGLSWWAMEENRAGEALMVREEIVGSVVDATESDRAASTTGEAADAPRPAAPSEPTTVVHEIGGVRVSTAAGFWGELEEGGVVLRGEDEGLRIRVSADPVFGVPVEAVLREVMDTVERDPTLSAVEPGVPPRGEGEKVRYREDPGDGSVVQWSTWVEAGRHVSVGCHTRAAATVVQRAACRIAEDSTEVLGEN